MNLKCEQNYICKCKKPIIEREDSNDQWNSLSKLLDASTGAVDKQFDAS